MRGNIRSLWLTMAIAITVSACGNDTQESATPPPAEVGFITISPHAVTLETELPGRTVSFKTAEVRPQVSGIIEERLFEEGQMVKKGQALYRIDKRVYAAQEATARANVEGAKAQLNIQNVRHERLEKLHNRSAVSQQEFDESKARTTELKAQVAAASAALESARINLDYTTIRSPIDGQIGRSSVSAGALVTAGQPEALATIRQLDPIYVDITQSAAKLRQLRQAIADGHLDASAETITLRFEDGSPYVEKGTLQFAEVAVNESTGSVTLRALFPNPEGVLLPGMYVRASVPEGQVSDAILIPQMALRRDPRGNASVFLLDDDDKVIAQPVVASRTVGNKWLVTEGLNAGDRLIIDGVQRIQPGVTTTPVALSNHEGEED